MKKLMMVCCLLCLVGCAIQKPNAQEPINKTILTNDEKVKQVAIEFLKLKEVPKNIQVTTKKYDEKAATQGIFYRELKENEEFYVVDLDLYDDRLPNNQIVYVSVDLNEVVGMGYVD